MLNHKNLNKVYKYKEVPLLGQKYWIEYLDNNEEIVSFLGWCCKVQKKFPITFMLSDGYSKRHFFFDSPLVISLKSLTFTLRKKRRVRVD